MLQSRILWKACFRKQRWLSVKAEARVCFSVISMLEQAVCFFVKSMLEQNVCFL